MGRQKHIPLCEPLLEGNERLYLKECVETNWVSTAGPFVNRFEEEAGRYVEASHAVGVMNGTSALHIALLVVGVNPEDVVLMPDLTFVAPANAVRYAGAHPYFIDVDRKTWQLDVTKTEQFLSRECDVTEKGTTHRQTGRVVRALIAVHLLGLSCDMDPLLEIARKYKLKIIEDAAEGLGVRYKGKHVGTFGDVGILSFNGNKIATSGSGGILLTDSATLAKEARYLSTQAKDDVLESVHGAVGFNYRLSNVHAAIGLAQLEQIEKFIQKKREIAAFYKEVTDTWPGFEGMPDVPYCQATYWLNTILLPDTVTLEERKRKVKEINALGVGSRALWAPLHLLPPYQNEGHSSVQTAMELYRRGISLPSSVGLGKEDLERVVQVLRKVI